MRIVKGRLNKFKFLFFERFHFSWAACSAFGLSYVRCGVGTRSSLCNWAGDQRRAGSPACTARSFGSPAPAPAAEAPISLARWYLC